MFDKQYRFKGRHALRVDQLTGVFDELSKAKLIDRNVDVYTNAPLIGFLYGRTADLDDLKNPETGQIYNQNVMGDRVIYSGDELQYNFWLIMLLDANYEPDEEKRIDKAFRHYGQDPADEERFDSYVRGGIDGLVGAGRTELLETIFGMRTRAAGNVIYNGKVMNFTSPKDAMDHGFALITEERKANGLFLKADITFNTTIANMNHYKNGFALSNDDMIRATAEEIKVMHTKCMGPDDMISSLSGGNQQKAIFGKWLERSPNIFMMDDPTRGIDVGAKYEIYELIINMAKQGKTIIVVSSEMPEILGITNRIGVMSNGHLAGIVNTKETNQEELLRLSAKYL